MLFRLSHERVQGGKDPELAQTNRTIFVQRRLNLLYGEANCKCSSTLA